jgi:hypothetical protein
MNEEQRIMKGIEKNKKNCFTVQWCVRLINDNYPAFNFQNTAAHIED